jgi:hypothetical protein
MSAWTCCSLAAQEARRAAEQEQQREHEATWQREHEATWQREHEAAQQRQEEAERCAWAADPLEYPVVPAMASASAEVAAKCLAAKSSSHAALTFASTVFAGLPSANARRRRSGALGPQTPWRTP